MSKSMSPILSVRDLNVQFRTRTGPVHAVNAVSFDLHPGELLGVVGESGSGKSVTMMALLGLLHGTSADISGGAVQFDNVDLLRCSAEQLRKVRGARIGFIFQDPMTSLNPVLSVGRQLMEILRAHMGMDTHAAIQRAKNLLELVGIPDAQRRLNDFPHQFSGGMRQRVMIAIALACDPQVLIADEPTTALDVTIQAQILELMNALRQRLGMAVIWITHDLGVVAEIADRVMVMYGGQAVEVGKVRDLFESPAHPYTKALLKTMPKLRGPRPDLLEVIEGQPPILKAAPKACTFYSRCASAHDRCTQGNPALQFVKPGHQAACFLTYPSESVNR